MVLLVLNHCRQSTPRDEEQIILANTASDSNTVVSAPRIPVVLATATIQNFSIPVFSNGTLVAARKVKLSMPTGGTLLEFPCRPGQRLKAGDLIARLDDVDLKYQIAKQETQLALATEEKNDRLFTQGGRRGVDSSVTSETLNYIQLSTGYRQATAELAYLRHQLTLTALYAPYAATVTEVLVQPGQRINSGQELLHIVDPLSLQVQFKVLENEAVLLSPGVPVWVAPIALPGVRLPAQVKTVIPVVSNEGLVEIIATLSQRHTALMEGMTVQVTIDRLIPRQLTVPKEARVLRSGRDVIFTYDAPSGLAKWNYVTVAHENDRFLAISEGLKAGDQVIIEGNANLAHDAEVETKN